MAAFDPFARQIFCRNDYVGVDGANTIDVINPATLEPKPILHGWWYPYPDDWFHPSSR